MNGFNCEPQHEADGAEGESVLLKFLLNFRIEAAFSQEESVQVSLLAGGILCLGVSVCFLQIFLRSRLFWSL